MTEIEAGLSEATLNGSGVGAAIPLPKKGGPRGMLPSTWLNRSLQIEYVDSYGSGVRASGTLLDLFPAGPVLNMGGRRTLICWERLVLCELIND